MRSGAVLSLLVAVFAVACGGNERPDLEAPPPAEAQASAPDATSSTEETMSTSGSSSCASIPLPAMQAADIAKRADDMAAAIRRWDAQLARCVGPSGAGDDSDATCTHAAWGELVIQAENAVYYLLGHMREMPRGACHEALSPELDAVSGFWQGAAPLDRFWLDEQERPPELFDLDSAVTVIRPVPARIRDVLATVCAP